MNTMNQNKPVRRNIEAKPLTNKDGVFTAAELISRNTKSIPCLIEPIFPKVGLCSLAGSSDTGKSSFLRQLAVSVCSGENEFLGFKINAEHGRSIYVSTEDDDIAVASLLNKSYGKTSDLKSFDGLTFMFNTSDLKEKLNTLLSENKVDLIIIDAFTDLYGKSMNDANQVRTFLNGYSQIAHKHKCLIIFLHHTGKGKDSARPSKHNLLGSQGFEAKMRLVIELRNDNNDLRRHLCIVKGNYLPSEFKKESFVLNFKENLTFEMTDSRVSFDKLSSRGNWYLEEQVITLTKEGKTQKEIAHTLNTSQSKVSRVLNSK